MFSFIGAAFALQLSHKSCRVAIVLKSEGKVYLNRDRLFQRLSRMEKPLDFIGVKPYITLEDYMRFN
jgi:hypothetical protein